MQEAEEAEAMPDADNMLGDGNVLPFPQQEPPGAKALRKKLATLVRLAQLPNVAEAIDASELAKIGTSVAQEHKLDRDSRSDWETRAKRSMDIAKQVKEGKNSPWENASNVKYPLLTVAALQFGARAYPAIVDGARVVKCQVMGSDPEGMKSAAADRVSQHMSYQLLYETEWESDVDTMVHQLPVVGCAFKKVYADGYKDAGFCDELVSAFDLVVNQKAKDLASVPRITHVFPLYPHEIAERQRAGTMRDVDLKQSGTDVSDNDAPHMLLEQHRYLDLDDDGVLEPWIVTVHEVTEQVLRIKPCFDPGEIQANPQTGSIIRIPRKEYFVKVPFIPDPQGGFYDLGFGHLLGDVNDEIDTSINQMNDAATIQNAGGGFVGSGVDIGKGKGEIRVSPGRYRHVRAAGDDLRKSIVPYEHPGPSATTLKLLELMISAGKDISGIQNIMVGETDRSETATTTMAKIEQGMKVFTAIYKRIFRALKKEFRVIYEINKAGLDVKKYAALIDQPPEQIAQDYQGQIDIMPVADPNNVTDMQRMAKAQLGLEQVTNGNPHVNAYEATKRAFEAARIERVEELLIPPPPPDQPPPPTPEEQVAKAKIEESQAQAQIKQQSAVMDLEAKQQALTMELQKKQAEMQLAEQELALKARAQQQDAELREAELARRWRELEVKEAEAKVKASESDAD